MTLPRDFAQIHGETLAAEVPFATNKEAPDAVKIAPQTVKNVGSQIEMNLPPHSVSGIRLE